ncbi:uncharacterized protein PHALS_14784 [Plasmopara halstedii]|uniref:Uncharacterized protein n=1 Tax=Plasmopara halstedii TaxID=4781 RepID=A0A0P1ATU8_PLAHL|nr:uncharacterized protein PHALS_14784 [Plasmopara halstedii]CEG45129.1 hypothetical protein PHALS_14784 [Plasmopara halstedii]|eukprot:XP_024581498.1 hypothetical protein PHALS_14784 [Plasmopara halstedii]
MKYYDRRQTIQSLSECSIHQSSLRLLQPTRFSLKGKFSMEKNIMLLIVNLSSEAAAWIDDLTPIHIT